MPDEWDLAKTRVLADNTAQGVFKHLRALESNRARVLTRWVWELLQNARDASNGDASLMASVELGPKELIFRHNGRGFTRDEITHLIYYGSTKIELDEAVGQFGSGFLTTHLLSPRIDVSGQLEDGRSFEFPLERVGDSVHALRESMDRSWEAFKSSLSPQVQSTSDKFTTTFRYPIEDSASDAVREGLSALNQCGPFVVAFNSEFHRIEIHSPEENVGLEVLDRVSLRDGLQSVVVAETENGVQRNSKRKYLLAEGNRIIVSVPLDFLDDHLVLMPANGTPRLLLGFPLIGTEDFSFPAVIHSFRFTPTEERDGVFLGQSDNPANRENEAVISGACELLVNLLEFAATSDWRNTYTLAIVPAIREQKWLSVNWFRECLKEQFVKQIRQIPAVVTDFGDAKTPAESYLPFAETTTAVEMLWYLLDGVEEIHQALPRGNEAVGWCSALKSWSDVCECPVVAFDEAIDGAKLASRIEKAGSLDSLQSSLRADVAAVDWLNGLHAFLVDDGFDEEVRTLRIIPDQNGTFHKLSDLHRDQDIAEELKDIAVLLGWDLRSELRDIRLSAVADEAGAGDHDSEDVVRTLVTKLQDLTESELNDDCAGASVGLFAWIVEQQHWAYLRGFPAFSESSDSGSRMALRLERVETSDPERPLAPVQAWPDSLQPFSDLFPWRYVLADAFFQAVSTPDAWRMLDEQGFIRTDVVIRKDLAIGTFLPDEPLPDDDGATIDHRTVDPVTVTDIAFLTKADLGIMARVRKSRQLARLFWSFLTDWLVANDPEGLEMKEASCECEDTHRYYQGAWLVPLVKNKWVPLEGRRSDHATAKSLANLIRESEWKTDSLHGNARVSTLLKALRVSVPELVMELIAADDEARAALEGTLADMLATIGEDWTRLHELVEDMQDDEELFDHLAERRGRRRMVRDNQRLGKLVEDLVKESLEAEGFTVERTGIGSDFEIEHDLVEAGEEMALELAREGDTWLVEVKATRGGPGCANDGYPGEKSRREGGRISTLCRSGRCRKYRPER